MKNTSKKQTWLDLQQLESFLCKTALSRRNGGAMPGNIKKDGTPDIRLLSSELEFYIGAYSCLTFVMSKLEDISHDEAMRYFSPVVMFSGFRGDSITDQFMEKLDKKAVSNGI